MKHYVYFIKCCDDRRNFIKIGVAKNVNKRLDSLQTANPYKLVIVDIYEFESKAKAYAAEKRLHRIFKPKNIRGEWFKGNIKWSHFDFLPKQIDDTYHENALDQLELVHAAKQYI